MESVYRSLCIARGGGRDVGVKREGSRPLPRATTMRHVDFLQLQLACSKRSLLEDTAVLGVGPVAFHP